MEYDLVKPASAISKDNKGPKTGLLDPSHTHFLLVDTASAGFGDEIAYRAELERVIHEDLKIPITVLVVGGGPRTALSVVEALAKGTPCVFFEVFYSNKRNSYLFYI